MGTEDRSRKREFQLRAGVGFCVFKGLGCENHKRKVAGYGILIFTRPAQAGSSVNEVCRLSSNELIKEE